MFKKEIHIPDHLASECVFELVEKHFDGRYQVIMVTDKKFRIKKNHPYSYSNKLYELRKLAFNDSGNFLIVKDKLIFQIELRRQIFFWVFMMFIGMFLTFYVFDLTFFTSLTIICMPIILIWVFGIMGLSVFLTAELDQISAKIKKRVVKYR